MTQPVNHDDATAGTQAFRRARDFLLAHRDDYATAYAGFRWPDLDGFNWASDWFDRLALEQPAATALWMVEEDGSEQRVSFAEMADRSRQVAGWLSEHGVGRGDRVLLVLGNCVPLWETMLACIRMGAVMIPATTLLSPADVEDRVRRGNARAVVAHAGDAQKFATVTGDWLRVSVGGAVEGWLDFSSAAGWRGAWEDAATSTDDTLLLYFTSGTTAQPKLVEHTHASYPVGHLSTMYWIGLQPGDVHLNISSPGWAKHAWSCVFAPWNAGATVLIYNFYRFDGAALLEVMRRCEVSTFCAPPTVWRMLVQQDLRRHQLGLREVVGAGEPLNPEIIEQVQRAWGMTIRDGFGQTETTAQIGNPPGQPLKLGSMGRALPGYVVSLVDRAVSGEVGSDGEICLELARRPLGLMVGYREDAGQMDSGRTDEATRGGFYHTGDMASVDDEGYITYVGRSDDVFKASDYRISPFELESVLVEHPAVAEAAVVPAPDPVRLAVPKAYVLLGEGHRPSAELATEILAYAREHLAPYKRIRKLEFAQPDAGGLPKTISGKIRRVELRAAEQQDRSAHEYTDGAQA